MLLEREIQMDWRYKPIELLGRRDHRVIYAARDVLLGDEVIVKTDQLPLARQELRTLLALPPGIGPRVLDVIWTPKKDLALVLEKLSGKSLLECASDLPLETLPGLVRSIAQCLLHLHRTEFVHGDLNPSNIVVLSGGDVPAARLLDFGFALSRVVDPAVSEIRGGMPQFMAPELYRGWLVDGRADLFSLGRTLESLWPALKDHAKWGSILEKLAETIPARRYANAKALRDEIEERFGLAPSNDRYPRFPAGPLYDREEDISAIVAKLTSEENRNYIVQSRPRVGLSRFLFEVVLRIAEKDGPPIRIVDLGPAIQADKMAAFMSECAKFTSTRASECILWGVPDPTPGFSWLPPEGRRLLDQLVGESAPPSFHLRPVSEGGFAEMVAMCLRGGSEAQAKLVQHVYDAGSGDLTIADDGFAHLAPSASIETDEGWDLQEDLLLAGLSDWRPPEVSPRWTDLPPAIQAALATVSHLGPEMDRPMAQKLTEAMSLEATIDQLIEAGGVRLVSEKRLAFLTRTLWQTALCQPTAEDDRIDHWLNQHYEPELDRADSVVRALQRAMRINDEARARRHLGDALTRDGSESCWAHVRALLAMGGNSADSTDSGLILQQINEIHRFLGGALSREAIIRTAAVAIAWDLLPGCRPLYEEMLLSDDPDWVTKAYFGLLRESYVPYNPIERDRCMEILEARERQGLLGDEDLVQLDYYRGYHAMTRQETEDTVKYARRAIAASRGKSSRFAVASYNLLLNMVRFTDIDESLKLVKEARLLAHHPRQIFHLVSDECGLAFEAGRLRQCVDAAQQGIRELTGLAQASSRLELRVTRADAWADLGLVSAAMREVEIAVGFRSIRGRIRTLVPALETIGNCHLYGGSPPHLTLSAYAYCWEVARSSHSPSIQGPALRMLLDAILDLQAWDTVTRFGEELRCSDGMTPTPAVVSTDRRADALRLMNEGKYAAAEETVREGLAEVRSWTACLSVARYLHHLGVILCEVSGRTEDQTRAEEALDLFREARQIIEMEGYDYHRGQLLLSEAKHLAGLGRADDALGAINEAIANARRIQSKQLLARCLQTRAEWTS